MNNIIEKCKSNWKSLLVFILLLCVIIFNIIKINSLKDDINSIIQSNHKEISSVKIFLTEELTLDRNSFDTKLRLLDTIKNNIEEVKKFEDIESKGINTLYEDFKSAKEDISSIKKEIGLVMRTLNSLKKDDMG